MGTEMTPVHFSGITFAEAATRRSAFSSEMTATFLNPTTFKAELENVKGDRVPLVAGSLRLAKRIPAVLRLASVGLKLSHNAFVPLVVTPFLRLYWTEKHSRTAETRRDWIHPIKYNHWNHIRLVLRTTSELTTLLRTVMVLLLDSTKDNRGHVHSGEHKFFSICAIIMCPVSAHLYRYGSLCLLLERKLLSRTSHINDKNSCAWFTLRSRKIATNLSECLRP